MPVSCSSVFGSHLDLHSGGIDLAFPHHENEIAQCEVFHQCEQWGNYFLHSGEHGGCAHHLACGPWPSVGEAGALRSDLLVGGVTGLERGVLHGAALCQLVADRAEFPKCDGVIVKMPLLSCSLVPSTLSPRSHAATGVAAPSTELTVHPWSSAAAAAL